MSDRPFTYPTRRIDAHTLEAKQIINEFFESRFPQIGPVSFTHTYHTINLANRMEIRENTLDILFTANSSDVLLGTPVTPADLASLKTDFILKMSAEAWRRFSNPTVTGMSAEDTAFSQYPDAVIMWTNKHTYLTKFKKAWQRRGFAAGKVFFVENNTMQEVVIVDQNVLNTLLLMIACDVGVKVQHIRRLVEQLKYLEQLEHVKKRKG